MITKKQIRKAYLEMDKDEKIARLEFWASLYIAWLGIDNECEAVMEDVVCSYEEAKSLIGDNL